MNDLRRERENLPVTFEKRKTLKKVTGRAVRKIVSHLPPRHMDDKLGLLYLKSLFPQAELEFLHPQNDRERLETYRRKPDVLLIDIGMDYNPEMGNFDHHQDLNLPSSVVLVMEHFTPFWREVVSEDTKEFIETVDEIDRKGFPAVAKEKNIPESKIVPVAKEVFLKLPEEAFEIKEQNPEGFYAWLNEIIKGEPPTNDHPLVKMLNRIEENSTEENKGPSFGGITDAEIEHPYTRFFLNVTTPEIVERASEKTNFPVSVKTLKEQIETVVENIEKKREMVKKAVKIPMRLGNKVINILIAPDGDPQPSPGEFFKEYPDAHILIQRNLFDPNHTSIFRNSANRDALSIDLNTLVNKVWGVPENRNVFTHKAGFITVVDIPYQQFLRGIFDIFQNNGLMPIR